jgi:hypothetical protein
LVIDKVLDDSKILICTVKDKDDVWSDVFGSGWEHTDWVQNVEYINCDWDKHGTAKVTYLDPDGDGETDYITGQVTVVDIANAMSSLTQMGWAHCGGDATFDDPDACTSDAVLQIALLGEFVYG